MKKCNYGNISKESTIEYKILMCDCISELEKIVNEYIKVGWKLQGGLVIRFSRSSGYLNVVEKYYQTLFK